MGLKEGLVECVTVCGKSEDILIISIHSPMEPISYEDNLNFWLQTKSKPKLFFESLNKINNRATKNWAHF